MQTFSWTYDDIQCFVTRARCCHGQKAMDLSDKIKYKGINSCIRSDIRELLMLNHKINTLARYAPKGDIIHAEELASFTFRIDTLTPPNGFVSVSILGKVYNTSYSGSDTGLMARAIKDTINATPYADLLITSANSASSVTIYAPVGSGYSFNGTPVSITTLSATTSTFCDPVIFTGGVDEVLADTPCITDKKAKDLYEQINQYCGCASCGNENYYKDLDGSTGEA